MVSLIENAPHNLGINKAYIGVAISLFAFACKISFEQGNDGYVSFVAKTNLIAYYQKLLNAKILSRTGAMAIETPEAKALVDKFFTI